MGGDKEDLFLTELFRATSTPGIATSDAGPKDDASYSCRSAIIGSIRDAFLAGR